MHLVRNLGHTDRALRIALGALMVAGAVVVHGHPVGAVALGLTGVITILGAALGA